MTAPASALARLPRGAGPAPLAAVAQQLLDWVVDWYERHDGEVTPLPARRYVAPGAPREVAWDGEEGQVTVALERIIATMNPTTTPVPMTSPRRDPANTGRLQRSASLEVQIVRCTSTGASQLAVPSADELNALGAVLMADAGHLVTALVDAGRDGILLREHVGAAGVAIGDLITLGPMGGTAAVAGMLTVPLL